MIWDHKDRYFWKKDWLFRFIIISQHLYMFVLLKLERKKETPLHSLMPKWWYKLAPNMLTKFTVHFAGILLDSIFADQY